MTIKNRYIFAAAVALFASSAFAADLSAVKVVFDPDFTGRTNMGRPAGETSELTVSFDQGYVERTGMKRDAKDVGRVTVSRDHDYMARTNMGGTAMRQPEAATALKQ
ncbi:MAG TPA: hypothetical protein VFB54_06955 [Burkholderiales bacterium]|nr:hypothetical protein [Burkholderiales bacterium]